MTDKTKAFFAEYDMHPNTDVEALQMLCNDWMFDFKFEVCRDSVKITITEYDYKTYCNSLTEAIEETLEFLISKLKD